MPKLFSSKCNNCDFETSISSGGHMYVLDESGNKVACPHPGEYHKIAEVLKISKDHSFSWIQQQHDKLPEEVKKKIEDNIGMSLQYICMNCFEENYLDKKRDELKCAKCGSNNLKYVAELPNKTCPKCNKGIIERVSKGIS